MADETALQELERKSRTPSDYWIEGVCSELNAEFIYVKPGLGPDAYKSLAELLLHHFEQGELIHHGIHDLLGGEQPQPLSHQAWVATSKSDAFVASDREHVFAYARSKYKERHQDRCIVWLHSGVLGDPVVELAKKELCQHPAVDGIETQ